MNNYVKPNTFSTTSNEDHRRRRGRYATIYSKSNMATGEGYEGIKRRTGQVLDEVKRVAKYGRPVDDYKLFHHYYIDNASIIASGTSARLLEGENPQFAEDLRDMFRGLSGVFYFQFITLFLKIAPLLTTTLVPRKVMQAYTAHERVQENHMNNYVKSRDTEDPEFRSSVLAKSQGHEDYASPDLSDLHIASEISGHLLAGSSVHLPT